MSVVIFIPLTTSPDPIVPASDGTWSTTVDPTDVDLGVGTFTLVAQAQEGTALSRNSNEVTITIVCPPTIDDPIDDDNIITACGEGDTFTVSGTSPAGTDSIILYKKVGCTLTPLTTIPDPIVPASDGTWSTTVDPTHVDLGVGTFDWKLKQRKELHI